MIKAYEKYVAAGFACLPTGPDKMPFIPKGESWVGGWKNKHEYTISYGIGLICGKFSGNLECIDFDNHFGDAKIVFSEFLNIEGVRDIIRKHELPAESTVSGGFHLLFRCDLNEGNQKLASRPKPIEPGGRKQVDVLIETRGEGGYFVVDPTPGYKVINHDIFKVNYISAEERGILLSACRTFNKNVKVYKSEEEKNQIGDVYNRDPGSVNEMISALENDGWVELGEGIWRRPGKNKGISATLGRAAPGIFYNFSSSASPFEMDRGYTAFRVVGLLKYNEDFKAFAKDLHERYDKKEGGEVRQGSELRTEKKLDNILEKSHINLEIPVAKPPIILRIKSRYGASYSFNRVFTLGNFSVITGKSKAKKTFLTSLLLTALTTDSEYQTIFKSDVPQFKPGVALFDTEQSPYDAYITAHRVWELAGEERENFVAFDLREYTPFERCDIIEKYFTTVGDRTSFVVIDGIADLATAINDEIEASRVTSLLMKWTKIYNIHICVVIHQNKNDNYATGHLGSAIIKKAECVISVTKDPDDSLRSEVSCDLMRGTSDFDKFRFMINEKGLPVVEFANSIQPEDPFINL
jgi:hypothetical protein